MPMKLANGSLLQMLLSSCDVVTCRKIGYNLFPSPTSIEDLRLGITEAPFEVGNKPTVSALSSKVIGILEVELMIRSSC